jgi:hypothetical protein
MTKRTCNWCTAIIEVPKEITRKHNVYCSIGCRDANRLFEMYSQEEEINRRYHYAFITGYRDPFLFDSKIPL